MVTEQEQHAEDVEQFISKCKEYTDLTELTLTILNDLVRKVCVETPCEQVRWEAQAEYSHLL